MRPPVFEAAASRAREVLEIGVGTGLNLPYYPAGMTVTAIDPDPRMLRRTADKGGAARIQVARAAAEALPFADGSFDTVVATLVFCSVRDPRAAMGEVFRVLRPGGVFLLLEHVRANSRLVGRLQDALTPAWKYAAGGCHLNRNPDEWIDRLSLERLDTKILWRGAGKFWVLRKNR